MARLNTRDEEFCRLVTVGGKSDTEAYRLAGFKGKHADKRAAELRGRQGIKARIAEIKRENTEIFRLSREQVLNFLADVIETPIGEVTEKHRLAQEIGFSNDGGMTKLKMPGKIEAARLAGQWCGWEKGNQAENKAADAMAAMAAAVRKRAQREGE